MRTVHTLGIAAVLLTLIVSIPTGILFQRYKQSPAYILTHSAEGFTYLEPSYLPKGVIIESRTLSIFEYQNGGYPGKDNFRQTVSAWLSFRNVDNVYSISEWKKDVSNTADLVATVSNYSTDSVRPTCKQSEAKSGKSFRLCHWIDYDKFDVYEMRFTQENTYVYTQLMQPKGTKLAESELQKFVGSFSRASADKLKISRHSSAL